jgi:cholesterol oxidase
MQDTGSSRRDFVAAVGALAAGACLPRRAQAAAPVRAKLSLPIDQLRPAYDVVVIGSGYGGAVMAARLASGRSLCVLERGKEWQPGDFPSSLTSSLAQFRHAANPLGLFDYRAGATMDVLAGNGLGGTSLINANVVIAADRDAFARWPLAIRQDVTSGAMARREDMVRQMLSVDTVTEADALRKTWFHRSNTLDRARQGVGVTPTALPLAVNLRRYVQQPNAQGVVQAPCTHCGDCVTGCRMGAKNTLDVNYLPLARSRGAQIFAGVEVEWLERLADGRWRVHHIVRGSTDTRGTIIAGSVVLSAGVLGSTQILLRSQAQGLALSPALGTRFSANGDLLGFAYNSSVQTNTMGFGSGAAPFGEKRVGPTITMAADYRLATELSQRFLLEEGAVPSSLVDALRLALPAAAGLFADFPAAQRVARDLLARRSDGALNHSQVFLGIGHDSASGRIELDSQGQARVVWPQAPQEPFVQRLRSEMERHAAVFSGRHVDSPRSHPIFGGALTTVHPLGGCPMSDSAQDGVVNADTQVHDPRGAPGAVYSNLRVVDGSVCPASIGVNPLLTIAAIAERAAERFA